MGRSFVGGGGVSSHMPRGVAAFFLRLVAYFQGALAAVPRLEAPIENRMIIIDEAVSGGFGPLQKVRLNRHISRRLRWLIRRGRLSFSGKMRMASKDDVARCNLTPGQFREYCIRARGYNRIKVYRLGFTRRALFLNMLGALRLSGDAASLSRALSCNALIAPD